MGVFDFLFEGDTDTQSLSTTSPSQQGLEKAISEFLQANIGKGAQPYPGQLPGTAEVPGLFNTAYQQFESQFGGAESQQAISDLISARPGFTFDPGATASRWEETYSTPVMNAWRDTVAPILENQYNIPGGFYSTRKGTGVSRAANEFYGGQVAPTLFTALQQGEQRGFESKEAALGRQPAALGLPGQQFQQAANVAMAKLGLDERELTAMFNEFLRTRAEPGWAVGAGAGFSTAGTRENVVTTSPSLFEQFAPVLGGLAGGWAAGGFMNPLSGAPAGFENL